MPVVMKHIDRERPLIRQARASMQRLIADFLSKLRADVVASARADVAVRDQKPKHAAATTAEKAEWAKLGQEIEPYLRLVSQDGASEGLAQVAGAGSGSGGPPTLHSQLEQANEEAIAWAEDYAAELVGMKRNEAGEWVTNPNATWAISETTRDRVNALVAQAEEEGWSNDDLADALDEDGIFGSSRAEMIARTETAFADIQGNLIGWDASGVVAGKQWTIGTDQIEICEDCEALDGMVVGLDEEFPGGDPPLHPRCRCDVLSVLGDEDED